MEHHKSNVEDKPIGAPHTTKEDTSEERSFEIGHTKDEQPQKPRKTWKTMPLWKKILVIWFSIVCAFGIYDTFFPSEKSLKMEELFPIIATPTVAPLSPTSSVSATPFVSPTALPLRR